jgi:hypothetical protein
MISAMISSLRDFFVGVTEVVGYIYHCWGQELGLHVLHFPLNPLFNVLLRNAVS